MYSSKVSLPLMPAKTSGPSDLNRARRGSIAQWCLAVISTVTLMAAAGPVLSADVAELSTEVLEDGSVVQYQSSFCEVSVSDMVSVTLTDVTDPMAPGSLAATVQISAVEYKNMSKENKNAVTPNGEDPGKTAGFMPMTVDPPTRSVDITLASASAGWHTVHLRLVLITETGEAAGRLGVNLNSTPCDDTDGAT